MKGSRRKVLKAGAALAATAAASTFPRFAIGQSGPVKIGMSMPQTGSLGAGGNAARLLKIDYNSRRGGVKS